MNEYGPVQALSLIDLESGCMVDHISAMIAPATTLGVLVELDALKMALEGLHEAARRQVSRAVH